MIRRQLACIDAVGLAHGLRQKPSDSQAGKVYMHKRLDIFCKESKEPTDGESIHYTWCEGAGYEEVDQVIGKTELFACSQRPSGNDARS